MNTLAGPGLVAELEGTLGDVTQFGDVENESLPNEELRNGDVGKITHGLDVVQSSSKGFDRAGGGNEAD